MDGLRFDSMTDVKHLEMSRILTRHTTLMSIDCPELHRCQGRARGLLLRLRNSSISESRERERKGGGGAQEDERRGERENRVLWNSTGVAKRQHNSNRYSARGMHTCQQHGAAGRDSLGVAQSINRCVFFNYVQYNLYPNWSLPTLPGVPTPGSLSLVKVASFYTRHTGSDVFLISDTAIT